MNQLSGQERMIKVLNLEEPDRVPHFDGVNPMVMDALLPGASFVDFAEFMDHDALGNIDKVHSWSYETVDEGKNLVKDQWGSIMKITSEVLGQPLEPAIKSAEDLANYTAPDPDEEWRYKYLKKVLKRFKGQRAVWAHATDVFNIASDFLLGPEQYYQAMINDPDLVDEVNEIVLNYNLRYLKNCFELGVDMFFVTGDYASTKGPFVSPEHTARFLIPALKKQVQLAKSMDIPVLKHTDGNIEKIFEQLIDTGINGIHPLDPIAGMDIGEAKAEYGDRVCLAGNVNCGPTLSWGTTKEVRQEVKDCIRKAGYGGGYICMSSNSIHSGVKPENYKAMVDAIREFGNYPLDMDKLSA